MANGHNSIKRIVHRSCEEIGATVRIARATSWPEAINTFRAKLDIQVMSRNGYKEPPEVRERLLRKHETVLKYLEGRFGDYYASYDYGAPLAPLDPALEGKIWMCWWQGEENAPEIVRACIDSVRRNAGGHEVVVITDENLSDYVDIPEWVLEKVRAGIMSRTHLSDLLRFALLAEYGGMWLDATFFCTGPLEEHMSLPMWSIKRPDYLHGSVACGMFANYSLACDPPPSQGLCGHSGLLFGVLAPQRSFGRLPAYRLPYRPRPAPRPCNRCGVRHDRAQQSPLRRSNLVAR